MQHSKIWLFVWRHISTRLKWTPYIYLIEQLFECFCRKAAILFIFSLFSSLLVELFTLPGPSGHNGCEQSFEMLLKKSCNATPWRIDWKEPLQKCYPTLAMLFTFSLWLKISLHQAQVDTMRVSNALNAFEEKLQCFSSFQFLFHSHFHFSTRPKWTQCEWAKLWMQSEKSFNVSPFSPPRTSITLSLFKTVSQGGILCKWWFFHSLTHRFCYVNHKKLPNIKCFTYKFPCDFARFTTSQNSFNGFN